MTLDMSINHFCVIYLDKEFINSSTPLIITTTTTTAHENVNIYIPNIMVQVMRARS